MAEQYGFFDSTSTDVRSYTASDFAEFWASFFSTGVISGLTVSAVSDGVRIESGYAIIDGYWYHLDEPKILGISSSATASTKTVVLKLDLGSDSRKITAELKSGTELDSNSEIHEIALAQFSVAANATTAQNITDERTMSTVQPEADIGANTILSKIFDVDGPGSGLDADLLDGQHGSFYGNYANLTNKPILYGTSAPSDSSGVDGNIYIRY